jgi:hypothetical protein
MSQRATAASLLLAATSVMGLGGACAADWTVARDKDDAFNAWFLVGDKPVLSTRVHGWGRGGKDLGQPKSTDAPVDGKLSASTQWCGLATTVEKSCTAEGTFVEHYALVADDDYNVLMLVEQLSLSAGFKSGQLAVTTADGKESTLPIPWPKQDKAVAGPDLVKGLVFHLASGDVAVGIDPPCRVNYDDNKLRIAFAADKITKGTTAVALTWTFPAKATLAAQPADIVTEGPLAGAGWFPLQRTPEPPLSAAGSSAIDMSGWLEAPAGKRGPVRTVGDHFEFADGTRIKFWGTNLAYSGNCAPEKKWADATAERFARFGLNAVRLHKFTSGDPAIIDPNDATALVPAAVDRLDYFCSRLKEKGIYYGFSHTYGFIVAPGNKPKLLSFDEIQSQAGGNTTGLINFAEDVQDLLIQRVVNLLTHENPYTKQPYAKDPALAYIELQNEDDIFWYSTAKFVDAAHFPTYTKYLQGRFSDWLKKRYATDAGLAKAWDQAVKPGETLDGKNIAVQGNPWFFGPDNLGRVSPGERRRMLDNALFLRDVQDAFYAKFVKAIRDTGYQGSICGSPWQAPAMVPEYHNLRSDHDVGWIDRHDYFGGGLLDSMLAHPGSGYLSAGLQQVADRPFGISEWIHVYPSLYSAEGPALFAAYGMGLQGWDASFEFQSAAGCVDWSEIVGNLPWGVWNADVPTQLGQAPTLARMIYRGDVKEGDVVSTRRVSEDNLRDGTFDFHDDLAQTGDIKTFAGSCPPIALAAGRCLVEFVKESKPSTFPDLTACIHGSVITSTTKQLSWDFSGQGFFTVDTPGTKAVCGFADGKPQHLGDVTIAVNCPYASVFLVAAGRSETLANAKTAILSAVARNCNTGMVVNSQEGRMLGSGGAPVMLEPVKATITIPGRAIAAVNILDHDGNRGDRTVPVTDGSFTIDGAQDHAFYYEVVFR